MGEIGLSLEERESLAREVTSAEAATSGEIVVVLAPASDGYRSFGLLWSALLALAVPLPLIYWTALTLTEIYLIQLAVFLVAIVVTSLKALRYRLVPRGVKRERAHARAVEQFLVQNLHTTCGRTGILLYVSFAERFAEVLADQAVYEKLPPEAWQAIVDRLTAEIGSGDVAQGIAHAIRSCGEILAAHFPPGASDCDELPNHLILLDAE